ncbi:MAG TPA: hypothetical protein VKY37_07345 [Brumimicrobium sp.]|nr:hypothetical protein [Brumimicrobium sp.]
MKILSFLFIVGLFVSCNSSSNQLCDCVEAGDEVNRISASFFERLPTKEGEDSLIQAKKVRDELCLPFQQMMPKELHEKAAECEALKITPEQ